MSRSFLFVPLLWCLCVFSPQELRAEFLKVVPGKVFQFPRDHGTHDDYPVEWWYFTGHLRSQSGKTFGFELTFFRIAVNPSASDEKGPWHVQSLFLGHSAVTDDSRQRFYFREQTSRPSFGRAQASSSRLEIRVGDWSVKQVGEEPGKESFVLKFHATDERTNAPYSLTLELNAKKGIVLQGDKGFSRKGEVDGDASYYTSFTRLEGSGTVEIEGEESDVIASAWMDHEVLSSSPGDEKVGWDWFAIQLKNGWECMLYHLRRGSEGKTSPYSSGSCISPTGEKTSLEKSEYVIQAHSTWTSPATKISYPASWTVEIPKLKARLEVRPTVPHQELASEQSLARRYWEGRALVEGDWGSTEVTGDAYVELVGY